MNLPNDIWNLISEHISDINDIVHLLVANKFMRRLMQDNTKIMIDHRQRKPPSTWIRQFPRLEFHSIFLIDTLRDNIGRMKPYISQYIEVLHKYGEFKILSIHSSFKGKIHINLTGTDKVCILLEYEYNYLTHISHSMMLRLIIKELIQIGIRVRCLKLIVNKCPDSIIIDEPSEEPSIVLYKDIKKIILKSDNLEVAIVYLHSNLKNIICQGKAMGSDALVNMANRICNDCHILHTE